MSDCDSVLIVCGVPRSGTTWLHDVLIRSGQFRGIIIESDKHDPYKLGTDEYRPLIHPGVLYKSANSKEQEKLIALLKKHYSEAESAFVSGNGKLMLKAPQFVFCIDALLRLLDKKVRFIFLSREPLDVAVSMSRHPLISKQLLRQPRKCGDFNLGKFFFERSIDVQEAHRGVLQFAEKNWSKFTVVERALLKWHYFNRAYVLSSQRISEQNKLKINYSDFLNSKEMAVKLSHFMALDQNRLEREFSKFEIRKHDITLTDLSDRGRQFYELCVNHMN